MKFKFSARRLQKPEDQIDGLTCAAAEMMGEVEAKSESAAWETVQGFLFPGAWIVNLRTDRERFPARAYRSRVTNES